MLVALPSEPWNPVRPFPPGHVFLISASRTWTRSHDSSETIRNSGDSFTSHSLLALSNLRSFPVRGLRLYPVRFQVQMPLYFSFRSIVWIVPVLHRQTLLFLPRISSSLRRLMMLKMDCPSANSRKTRRPTSASASFICLRAPAGFSLPRLSRRTFSDGVDSNPNVRSPTKYPSFFRPFMPRRVFSRKSARNRSLYMPCRGISSLDLSSEVSILSPEVMMTIPMDSKSATVWSVMRLLLERRDRSSIRTVPNWPSWPAGMGAVREDRSVLAPDPA